VRKRLDQPYFSPHAQCLFHFFCGRIDAFPRQQGFRGGKIFLEEVSVYLAGDLGAACDAPPLPNMKGYIHQKKYCR
jgi:hypothetical protein